MSGLREDDGMTKLRIALVAAAFSICGCLTTTYNTGLPAGGEVKKDSASFYIAGWLGQKDLNLSELCPNGVSTWKQFAGVGDAVFSICTCGIYTPMSVEVTCSNAGGAKTSYLLTPDSKSHRTLVQPLPSSCQLNAKGGA
jgi:hypothetical protein